jgi:hypothetical protein
LNLAPLLIGLLMWAGSALMFWLFVRGLRLRIAMKSWLRMRGVVYKHEIHSHRNLHGSGHHRAVVTVEVSSPKRRLKCDSPTRRGFAQEDAARSFMQRFPIGESVEIYVDPKNPERAFLYLPEMSALLLLLLGSLFLLAFGIGIN